MYENGRDGTGEGRRRMLAKETERLSTWLTDINSHVFEADFSSNCLSNFLVNFTDSCFYKILLIFSELYINFCVTMLFVIKL